MSGRGRIRIYEGLFAEEAIAFEYLKKPRVNGSTVRQEVMVWGRMRLVKGRKANSCKAFRDIYVLTFLF